MLIKFENKSQRVKCIAFHPKRTLVLVSLHNGQVQLWDYQLKSMLDKYQDHDGPVRACAFHPSQPLFATGGDDGKVRVYNYRQRKCLYTLSGHLDYVRSVTFHPGEQPWLMSASDDQTVRIWNWQSRTCVTTLTGHTHYVMCAQFHPREDLVVTASLDNTVRVWDVANVRKKSSASTRGMSPRSPAQLDLFVSSEGHVKFVLEGHDRGVNWACFHPSKPLIVSGSDDRSLKLWRYNEVRAWETDTLRGHLNNVSCVMFYAGGDLIVSASEDKTLRVWDYSKRSANAIHVFKRDGDRFWSITGHPQGILLGVAHDSGFQVFKLERERPAFCLVDDGTVFYARKQGIKTMNLSEPEPQEHSLVSFEKSPASGSSCHYSPSEKALLLSSAKGFDLVLDNKLVSSGPGGFGVFIARNRFLTVNQDDHTILEVRGLDGNAIKTVKAPFSVRKLFPAVAGSCVLVDAKGVGCVFDVQQGKRTQEFKLPEPIHYIFWSLDMSTVAAASKHHLQLYERGSSGSFELTLKHHEPTVIKGGSWDGKIFFYNTLTHLKYVINLNQSESVDTGIVCSLPTPLYLIKVQGEESFFIDRSGSLQVVYIDTTEFKFKLALRTRDMMTVKSIIEKGALVGQAIIEYLRRNGFAEIALHFVADPRARFPLALEAGHLELALNILEKAQITDERLWDELAEKAMLKGNIVTAEAAWRQTKNYQRLSFMLLLTGQLEKLKTMNDEEIPDSQVNLRMMNRLYLGDYEGISRMLADPEQEELQVLAYMAAVKSGNSHLIAQLKEKAPAGANIAAGGSLPLPKPLDPQSEPWPLVLNEDPEMAEWSHPPEVVETREIDEDLAQRFEQAQIHKVEAEEMGATGWEMEDLDIPEVQAESPVINADQFQSFSIHNAVEEEEERQQLHESRIAFVQAALGNVDECLELLNGQAGAQCTPELKTLTENVGEQARLSDGSLRVDTFGDIIPVVTKAHLRELLERGWNLTTNGKFDEAIKSFRQVLQEVLMAKARTEDEAREMMEMVPMCRDYILGLSMDLKRRRESLQPTESLELACYFAHLPELLPEHKQLALRSAMTLAYKQQCLRLSSILADSLLQLEPASDIASQVCYIF